MLTALVQQVDVCWVLDIGGRDGGVQQQLTTVLILLLLLFFLLLRCIPVRLPRLL